MEPLLHTMVDKLKNATSNLEFGVIGTIPRNFVFCSYVTAKRPFDGNFITFLPSSFRIDGICNPTFFLSVDGILSSLDATAKE